MHLIFSIIIHVPTSFYFSTGLQWIEETLDVYLLASYYTNCMVSWLSNTSASCPLASAMTSL